MSIDLRKILLGLGTVLALFVVAGAPGASPALAGAPTFTVNATNDADDGTCDVAHCSMREAINANNVTSAILEADGQTPGGIIAFDYTIGDPPGLGDFITPLSELPPITGDNTVIDGYTMPGSSPNTNGTDDGLNNTILVVINGLFSGSSTDGLVIDASDVTVRGLAISQFSDRGIVLNGDTNVVEGSVLTTNGSGDLDDGGIYVAGTDNRIGGTLPAERNNIRLTDGPGIFFFSGTGHTAQGNLIGTESDGTTAAGNGDGVLIDDSSGNTIGGLAPGAGNVISGNDLEGVKIIQGGATNNAVQGNFIGVDINGTSALGNGASGVLIFGAPDNTVGGPSPAARNVISGNGVASLRHGVDVLFSEGAVVQGNYIGTDVSGTVSLENRFEGVSVNTSPGIVIGGAAPGEGNLISGNGRYGILLADVDASVVQGNLVGTTASGTDALGNEFSGLHLVLGSDNLIGGTAAGTGNTIAFNGRDGIEFPDFNVSTGNSILRNSIFANAELAIDLNNDGVTLNDNEDADDGANHLQNYPVLTSAISGSLTIEGSLSSTANTEFRIEFFLNNECDASGYGEGEAFLGRIVPNMVTDGSGDFEFTVGADITVSAGTNITATATNVATGDTSEFSQCVEVEGAPTPTPTEGPSPTPTATPTEGPSPTPTPSATPPDAPTATPTNTPPTGPTATLTPSPTSTPPAGTPGDVNCDSITNSIDGALILQLDAGLVGSLACQQNADLSGDGTINSIDAAIVLQCDAGLFDCTSLAGRHG